MQHKLLVMDVDIKSLRRKKRSVVDLIIMWWNLTSENATDLANKIKLDGSWNLIGDLGIL